MLKFLKILFVGALIAMTTTAPSTAADLDLENTLYMDLAHGRVVIRLRPDLAPNHVARIKELAREGFYDGTVFHRVIDGFMAQGGDPTGTGRGGPGYKYAGEFDAKVKHEQGGLLSMANAGPGTDGSQFFLTFVATPWLDGKHTIFGKVVEGMDVLKEMEKRGTRGGEPTERMLIASAKIE
jgi:cyclophilin family peptidyl-prolyl cis-trans isomerase